MKPATCALTGCTHPVKSYRNKYCSIRRFGLATRGVHKRCPRPRPEIGPFSRFTITPEKQQAYQPATESWWTKPDIPREGFTALAARRTFSQARNASIAPVCVDLA